MEPAHDTLPNAPGAAGLQSAYALDDADRPASFKERTLTMIAILVPLLGLVVGTIQLWGWGVSLIDLSLLLGLYVTTMLGITVGFHRLFTHKAFETTPTVKFLLGVMGSMAVQGSLFRWVAHHRLHHNHSDTPNDPHSPHHHGVGWRGLLGGIWHSHLGWFFKADPPDLPRYVPDLAKSDSLRVVSALFPVWIVLSLILPTILGGLMTGSWRGALTGFVWGGLVRILLVHHLTWSVNSACHLWGRRPFRSGDQSRNNYFFGLFAMGEGWHNTHHAFPTSARHGLRWWQLDASYLLIKILSLVGLAWNLRLPSKQAQAFKKRN